MFDITNLDENSEDQTIAWLQRQDDLFENEGDSDVDDATYDRVRRWAMLSFPANEYFTGVGSDVRGGKVNLPFSMTGLTQVYEGGDARKWSCKIGGDAIEYTISDKLDGTSAMLVYGPTGELQIAFSRGNGTQGADITRHIKRIPNIPKKIPPTGTTFPVRMEIEIKKSEWLNLQRDVVRKGGEPYKNARNAVAGIMNASTNPDNAYEFLNGIAYTIIDSDMDKLEQFILLQSYGFEVARHIVVKAPELEDKNLTRILNEQRSTSDYELDGIVIDVNKRPARLHAAKLGIPLSVKYKVADASNYAITSVIDVVYRASKDGYLKPRVNVKPVNLVGVTVNFATGFNAKFIKDNGIGPGAKIKITRSGDVIPFILGTVEPAKKPALPDPIEHGDWVWSKNEVDAVLSDTSSNSNVAVRKMVDIFTKLKISHLKDGNIEKLFAAGFTTADKIINADYTELYMVLGENGAKIDECMDEVLTNIYWPEFVGSLNIFGRGIGRRKLTALYDAFEGDISRMRNIDDICSVEGFDEKTAQPIVDKLDDALKFIDTVSERVKLKTYTVPTGPIGTKMIGQQVVFSGVRSAELEAKIVEEGGLIKTGISSTVTLLVMKDPTSSSGKARKARQLGIDIIDLKELEKRLYQ